MHTLSPQTSISSQKKSKTVHFASKDIIYSPPNPVSSPSPTPITPPSTSYCLPGPSPYKLSYPPQYPIKSLQYPGPIYAHPLLEMFTVTYNLMDHPSTIMTQNNHFLSTRTLLEQATNPPLKFLTISSIHLPWTIKVYASNGSYVTLQDIFDSLYRNLRTNITSDEFNLFSTKDDQRGATRAYHNRYRRFRNTNAYEKEKRGGMKRVDFLMGHTKLLGISQTPTGHPDEWQLHVA